MGETTENDAIKQKQQQSQKNYSKRQRHIVEAAGWRCGAGDTGGVSTLHSNAETLHQEREWTWLSSWAGDAASQFPEKVKRGLSDSSKSLHCNECEVGLQWRQTAALWLLLFYHSIIFIPSTFYTVSGYKKWTPPPKKINCCNLKYCVNFYWYASEFACVKFQRNRASFCWIKASYLGPLFPGRSVVKRPTGRNVLLQELFNWLTKNFIGWFAVRWFSKWVN